MSLPTQVQRQLDAAEAQAATQAQAQAQAPVAVSSVDQLLAAPPAVPAPAPAPVAQPAPAPSVDFEQKYKTLQGMYQAEVPQLRTKLATTESELVAMKEQLRVLTEAAKAKPKPQEPDQRDVDAFGRDMIEMVRRYAEQTFEAVKAEFNGTVQSVQARLSALEQTVGTVSAKTETTLEQQFFATLNALVPDWKQINTDQEWLAWLEQTDPVYRVPRQAALDAAHQRADVEGVAAVFNAFKSSRPAKPAAELAAQISPSSGGAGPNVAPVQDAPKFLSAKAVNQFYTDQARGKYVGREAEAAQIEAEINLAGAQGRII